VIAIVARETCWCGYQRSWYCSGNKKGPRTYPCGMQDVCLAYLSVRCVLYLTSHLTCMMYDVFMVLEHHGNTKLFRTDSQMPTFTLYTS